jgi:hypothetical protein
MDFKSFSKIHNNDGCKKIKDNLNQDSKQSIEETQETI